ncbi:MAG: histidine kinase [Bacteroidota bacterium]
MKVPTVNISEVKVRWIGIPIVAIFAMMAEEDHTGFPIWLSYLVAFLFTALYWNGACLIIFSLRRKYPAISQVRLRLFLSSIVLLLWMSFAGMPLKLAFGFATTENLFSREEFWKYIPFNLVVGLIVSLGYEASFFFGKWKEQFKLNEQLKSQQIRTQYEVLQNQMSPHFLFNSLNTLATLIPEDTKVAVKFTEKLSEVYRYILQNKERELVMLSEELDFAKNYMFLLGLRYPDNLFFEVDIRNELLDKSLPPLTIQMLVENAIKHNVVSKAKPLLIHIYAEKEDRLIVKNNLQPKNSLAKSTKMGLTNIRKRYSILGGKEVDIITTTSSYMVAVPLLEVVEEELELV